MRFDIELILIHLLLMLPLEKLPQFFKDGNDSQDIFLNFGIREKIIIKPMEQVRQLRQELLIRIYLDT